METTTQSQTALEARIISDLAPFDAVEAERVRVEAAERAAIAVAAERNARMSDKQKWGEWMETIRGTVPEMKSAAGKNAVDRVLAGLDKMTNDFNTNAQ